MANGIPNWQVTSVIPETDFQQGRGPIEGQRVQFTTDTGLSGSVFISNAEIGNAQKVSEEIVKRVTALSTLHNLSG